MNNHLKTGLVGLALLCCTPLTNAHPTATSTDKLGPFVGPGATFHSSNNTWPYIIEFAGTDLGYSYEHDGDLKILFGDVHAEVDGTTNPADSIDPDSGSSQHQYDDGYGSVDLSNTNWDDPDEITSNNIPLILLAQHEDEVNAKALKPGTGYWSASFQTPFGGWTNGTREYAIFYNGKPQACKIDSHCQNHNSDLTCDVGLAYWGKQYDNPEPFTGLCIDGTAWCINNPLSYFFVSPVGPSGFCSDTTSSMYEGSTAYGRVLGAGTKMLIGVRNTTDDSKYDNIVEWLTNKFRNVTIAAVQDFRPSNGTNQDYSIAGSSGSYRRVFLWGRPGFLGINDNGSDPSRDLGMYFAYVDMPTSSTITWTVNYFTHVNESGIPQFSTDESDAAALDLDADTVDIQVADQHDNVFLQSVVWIEELEKWVMFYGGSVSTNPPASGGFGTCGLVEFFIGEDECENIDQTNNAIHMRTASNPWGPWSPPSDVFNPGDPFVISPSTEGEYADGGMLYHPYCSGTNCAPHYDHPNNNPNVEFGTLYSPVIHAPWIKTVSSGVVDVIWHVSKWNPYGIELMRTRIEK